jgi:hypothetical protein
MTPWLILAVLGLVAWALLARRGPSAVTLAREAARGQDPGPVLRAAAALPVGRRSAFFHAAIGELWASWNRPLAARLVREYAILCPDEKLCQYWLQQVLQVEPVVAREAFDPDFLTAVYRPEVAKSCCQGSS